MSTEQTISPNTVKALSHFVARDQFRPSLTKIHIENGTAVAADGFILATSPTQTNGFTGNVDPAQLLNVAKTVKKCDRIELVTDQDEPRAVAWCTDIRNAGMNWGPLTVTDELYPDWKQIIPRPEEDDIQIQISPEVLGQIVKAAKAVDGQVVHMRIRQEPDTKPIRFAITGGSDPLSGVLMPMQAPKHDFS